MGKAPALDRAHTEVLSPGTELLEPVFVDSSGARRRRLRRFAYVVGTLLLIVMLLVWLSQFGSPARPSAPTGCSVAPAAPATRGDLMAPDAKGCPP
jgi:hypothetical protein